MSIDQIVTNRIGDPTLGAIFANIDKNTIGKDGQIDLDQLLLQQYNREVDWERTNPTAIAAMLQSLGMSRADALKAAAGVQGATSPISPFMSTGAQQLGNDVARVNATVQAAAQNAYNLVQLPYDNRVKYATAQLMTAQGTMLSEQRDGQALAAAAIQAAANNGFSFDNASASDVLEYLGNNPYSEQLIQNIQKNPYAYSALTALCSADYAARAASYDPALAAAKLKQDNALSQLTQNDVDMIELNNTLLSNQVYKDNIATALFQAVEYAKANYGIKLTEAESAKLQLYLDNIKEFNSLDLEILRKELKDAQMMNDPTLREVMLKELTESARFNAAQAIYGFSMTSLMQNAFTDEKVNNPTILNKAAEKYLYGIDLGGYQKQQTLQGWFGTVSRGIGTVAGAWLIGSKIASLNAVTPPMLNGFSPQFTATRGNLNYFGVQ